MQDISSSGDLAADRRYQWGLGAAESGDFEAARDLFAQTLELAPGWPAAWFGLGQALEALGRKAEAIDAYGKCLSLDGDDAHGAGLHLASLGGGQTPAAAPRAYVKTLFDQYAATFDRHLVEKLAYRGPEILDAALSRAAPGQIFEHTLDLGCGAGLFGAVFRSKTRVLTGVDLSPAMIFHAGEKHLYDRLAAADLLEFLDEEPEGGADLAAAADVFVYIGDLQPVFRAVFRALAPGGLFAFTAQRLDGPEFEAVSTRKDRGEDVPGWALVLRKV
jgi:predicted TPR repeat methyltransferase